jgi:hypothetical protein
MISGLDGAGPHRQIVAQVLAIGSGTKARGHVGMARKSHVHHVAAQSRARGQLRGKLIHGSLRLATTVVGTSRRICGIGPNCPMQSEPSVSAGATSTAAHTFSCCHFARTRATSTAPSECPTRMLAVWRRIAPTSSVSQTTGTRRTGSDRSPAMASGSVIADRCCQCGAGEPSRS